MKDVSTKLGYDSDDRLLIVHADDVGMCHSVNRATFEAFKYGLVTCGSILVPCPWFPEAAKYCRENPEADLGIHLTLNSEWRYYRWKPVSSIDAVPGLVDSEGYLWRTVKEAVTHAAPEEVEKELRAQIERAIEFGVKPTHIDTHMGTVVARAEFLEIYLRLGKEYKIPPMTVSAEAIERMDTRVRPIARTRAIIDKVLQLLKDYNFPGLDNLILKQMPVEFEERREAYVEAIEKLQPGINQIILHLGLDEEELRAIAPDYDSRVNDYKIFMDPRIRETIERTNTKLIGWKELASLLS